MYVQSEFMGGGEGAISCPCVHSLCTWTCVPHALPMYVHCVYMGGGGGVVCCMSCSYVCTVCAHGVCVCVCCMLYSCVCSLCTRWGVCVCTGERGGGGGVGVGACSDHAVLCVALTCGFCFLTKDF